MGKKSFVFLSISIWFLSVGSMLGVRYLNHKKPDTPTFAREAKAIFASLDSENKRSVAVFESGILRLGDGTYKIIGPAFEPLEQELLGEKKVSMRRIEFTIADPLALERRIMVSEAFKTLNNAEKKCYADGYGSIIFRNGSYFFYFDSGKYREYVLKYGTQCESCEELKKKTNK